MASTSTELVIYQGDWVRRVAVGQDPLVIGRAEGCQITLDDPKISRRHCQLSPAPGGAWMLEDLGSRTGTFLRDKPLQEPTPLPLGEPFKIGSLCLVLERSAADSFPLGDAIRDTRNLSLLLHTIGEIYTSRNTETLLRTIVDRALQLTGADRGALLLSRPEQHLEAVVARSADANDLSPAEVLTHSLPERVLLSGKPVLLTDVLEEANAPHSVLQKSLRSVLCAPLPGKDGPIGVLYADGYRPTEAFGPTECAVFEALAVHGALALERARLLEEQSRAFERQYRHLKDENAALKAKLGVEVPIGQSAPMKAALDLLRRVAHSDATVLLTGETGTGKEVLAHYLHRLSPRAKGPFVVVDCGAIPEGLIESELFGHEKGAFTGAIRSTPGRFREAEGGTIFLDEIGELPLLLQTRLLRVLQEKTIQPVGSSGRVPVDVRVVCATHRDLDRQVAEGKLRQDLYYRISVLTILIPALRKRGEDILLLAQHFLRRFTDEAPWAGFTWEAKEALLSHPWPGNVRELENRIHRAAILAPPPYITKSDLGFEAGSEPPQAPPVEAGLLPLPQARALATARFEQSYLGDALRRTGGNVTQAAKLAQVTRPLLQRMMREHNIDRLRYAKIGAEPDEDE
jgi:transcriptional regulator with GAF, ATPase, and Fis domain